VEDLIAEQLGDNGGKFIRLGRGLIINIHFVYRIDIATQQLVLSDCYGCYHELSASREVLIKLKSYMETLMKMENE
jgi:DNA-binding LytR/AlgR family response regulator